jgi:hypothetical protein
LAQVKRQLEEEVCGAELGKMVSRWVVVEGVRGER